MIRQEILGNAIRYWERGRLVFNIVLALIVAAIFFQAWPESKNALTFGTAQALFILAVLANIAYSVVYVVDLFVQYSELRATWLRFRWILFVIGLLFAAILTNFMATTLFNQPLPPR
jgi:hypothetical protein